MYVRELVKKFSLESSKHSRTPMNTTTKLRKYTSGKNVEQKFYRSMIWSLLYLTTSHPEISFSVGVCARYQANPKKSHLTIVKRIIRYINWTLDYGLWCPYDFFLVIVWYSNVGWARNVRIEKAYLMLVFLLVIVLWLGLVRNKTLYPYLLSKLSILLLEAIVHKFCGWRKCLKTIELSKGPWIYTVTTIVL